MKTIQFRHVYCALLLSSFSLFGCEYLPRFFSANVGPTFQYTRYHLGCLPSQRGFMVGPALDIYVQKPWYPWGYIGFRGLWDIKFISSCDGTIVDTREYDTYGHIGYLFTTDCYDFFIIPFTGIDFIYLRYEITNNILEHRYFQVNVPVGLYFGQYIGDCFEWGINTYYDVDAWTRLKVITPCLEGCLEQCPQECNSECRKIDLQRCHRFHIEAPLKWYYLTEHCVGLNVIWTPLFTWQKFNTQACKEGPLNIPELKQWHLGCNLTIGVNF